MEYHKHRIVETKKNVFGKSNIWGHGQDPPFKLNLVILVLYSKQLEVLSLRTWHNV